MYYFTASVPAFDRIELRRADSLTGLASALAADIWHRHAAGPMSKNIWAPEIHYIDGAWIIYFAAAQADADEDGCYDHRIYALKNDAANPMEGTFIELGQVDTGWESFALDATSFVLAGKRYLVWAQRDLSIPGNSNLYIAEMLSPVSLRLPAVLLSKPEYEWECQGFLVNEGPAVLIRNGKVFLTYSGSATDERYCMGLLWMDADGDPLDAKGFTKLPSPVLLTDEGEGIFGPGHNCFTTDDDGRDLLVFHARPYPGFRGTPLSDPNRHAYFRRIEYDEKGMPIFNH